LSLARAWQSVMRGENFHAIARFDDEKNAGLVPKTVTTREQARLEEKCLGQVPYSLQYIFNNPP
jgi:hypothetical protein